MNVRTVPPLPRLAVPGTAVPPDVTDIAQPGARGALTSSATALVRRTFVAPGAGVWPVTVSGEAALSKTTSTR